MAGQLDETIGGPAVNIVTAPFSKRRTVYGQIERQNLPAFFRTFDFRHARQPQPAAVHHDDSAAGAVPDEQSVCDRAGRYAWSSGQKLSQPRRPVERIKRLYALLFGREPTETRLQCGAQFVADGNGAETTGSDTRRC